MRLLCTVLLVASTALLAGCGGDPEPTPAPGTAANPVVAHGTEAANEAPPAGEEPGYQKLLDEQSAKPAERFTPCNLVTRAQARAIVGAPIREPVEAPQGPTCIYQSESGDSFVTVAVQATRFAGLRRQLRRPQRVAVADREAYCGTHGQPVLHVPLSGGRVLSISAPCGIARRFAATAVEQLDA